MKDLVTFDFNAPLRPFKLLNGTNGGPWHKRHASDQYHSNLADYTAARIPYTRNHDSAEDEAYGGPYCHDVTSIFRDFGADAEDPASYDFACTDENILISLEAGTKTFFRLGQTIEHQVKKHGTIPPPDFEKWAVICEHIIRHYTEGWADGFTLDMPYWEIWNEPDLDPDDSKDKRCWGGTQAQFFDFYETAAKHLKSCFPHLRIGGPALAYNEAWAEAFLDGMQARAVPIDFFSWHIYTTDPAEVTAKARRIRAMLDAHGYGAAESILDEWNYVKGWTHEYIPSLEAIHGAKGGAFLMAVMSAAQSAPIDLLLYYDTRPSVFNGVFDFYTCRPLKGYYAMKWYGCCYDLLGEIPAVSLPQDVYALCGASPDGGIMAIVTYYTDADTAPSKEITLDLGAFGHGCTEAYLVDETHDAALMTLTTDGCGRLTIPLSPNSFILLRAGNKGKSDSI